MPPARTGVADYSASLAAALRKLGHDIRINREGDVDLYHIGNNPLHRTIYERALRRPGAVIIHDAVLHHFHLGFDDERRYIEEFVFNYGEWSRGLAVQLWKNRARSAADPVYFDYAMLKRIAEAARLVVVHNPGAAAIVRSHAPNASILELPHLFEPPPPPDPYEVLALRHQWQLPAGAFVFGVFGHLRESKRLSAVLAAARETNSYLLVAGDFVSSDYARAIQPQLQGDHIIRAPYLAEPDFWLHAHSTDGCINLRYPTAGETSGIAIRLMGIGKPTLLSAGREASQFPSDTFLPVDVGIDESEMLAAYLLWLKGAPACAREIGESARTYIHRVHDAQMVARRLTEALQSAA